MTEEFCTTNENVSNKNPELVLSLGSNIGNSVATLAAAVTDLSAIPGLEVIKISSLYRTKPVDYLAQPDFYNICVLANCSLNPMNVLQETQRIEAAHGRRRDIPKGPRTLDIDLIKFGEHACQTEKLVLPHPRAAQRAFVLVPWLEIASYGELPEGPIAELVNNLDTAGVELAGELAIS